jgi:hypothetical protein
VTGLPPGVVVKDARTDSCQPRRRRTAELVLDIKPTKCPACLTDNEIEPCPTGCPHPKESR